MQGTIRTKILIGMFALFLSSCMTWNGPTGDDAYRLTCCRCEDEPSPNNPVHETDKKDRSTPSTRKPSPTPPVKPQKPKPPTKPDTKKSDEPMPGKPKKLPKGNKKDASKDKEPDVRPGGRHIKPGEEKKTPTPY